LTKSSGQEKTGKIHQQVEVKCETLENGDGSNLEAREKEGENTKDA
jgi:hypothetical protein